MKPDEVSEIGERFGISLDPTEAAQFADLAGELMLTLDPLGYGPRTSPEVRQCHRVDEGRPDPSDDPFNAIVRRCNVGGDGDGPLAGKRIVVKDTVAIAGIPLTGGSRILQGFIPNRDAVVVQRMLAAGARIVASTNTDYLALSGGGDTSFYGPMLNPFDRTRTTGGSSGGSAASLHYDWVDMALGGDQGGSIRVPASWCGVIGLKPTHSLVPYTGIIGLDPTIDHIGPMTRTALDAATLLQVIAGEYTGDPRQRSVSTQDYVSMVAGAGDSLSGSRIGVVRESIDPILNGDPKVTEAFREAVGRLQAMGATVVEVSIPGHLTSGHIGFATFLEGMAATAMSGGNGYGWKGDYWPELAVAFQAGLASHADQLSAQSKIMFILGTYLQVQYGGSIYAQAQNLRHALSAEYDRALEQCDVLVMPTTPGLPHPLDPEMSMIDHVLRGWGVLSNTSPTDLTGHPSISLPMSSVDGLPVGLMATGRQFDDGTLLRMAASVERKYGWASARLDLPSGH